MRPAQIHPDYFYCDDCGRLFNKTERIISDIERCTECDGRALIHPITASPVESVLKEIADAKAQAERDRENESEG